MINSVYKNYLNLAIFGKLDSGKCSIAKSLTITCHCITTPNNFTYNFNNYFILSIPCSLYEFKEKYDLSVNICDVSLIVIDLIKFNENSRQILDYELLSLLLELLHKNVSNILICLNKVDKVEMNLEKYEIIVNEIKNFIYDNLKVYSKMFNMNQICLSFVPVSAKENWNISSESDIDLDENNLNWYKGNTLLDSLYKISKSIKSNNGNNNFPIFNIFDYYKEEEYLVISGKTSHNTKLKLNEEILIIPSNKKMKIEKISNCEGIYVDEVSERQFVTLKFKLVSDDIQISRDDIITKIPNDNNCIEIPNFNTFEADLIFIENINLNSVISPGFSCMICYNSTEKECVIESILGEYENDTLDSITKKKFIRTQNNLCAKVIITNNSNFPIIRTKFDVENNLGSFILKVQNRNIAYGKVQRYKKIQK